jgi:Endoribonuclease L-PSP
MANIQQYAARGVWDPPTYSHAVKVTGGETILHIAGQVAYDNNGNAAHPGDFKAQARAALQAVKAQVEAGGGTMANIVKVNTSDRYPPPRRFCGNSRGVLRKEDAGLHFGCRCGAGAARVSHRDRSSRGDLGVVAMNVVRAWCRSVEPSPLIGEGWEGVMFPAA